MALNLSFNGPGTEKDMQKTAPKQGSSVITLSPYTPPQTIKRSKKPRHKTINFDDMFGPERWTKYYEIQAQIEDDFELYNMLAEKVGTDVLFRRQADGTTLIEAANNEQSELLQKLMKEGDPKLPVKENQTLNTCHGTIIVPHNMRIGENQFPDCSEKIKENLNMQGFKVRDLATYNRPPRGNRKHTLRIAKIAFKGRILPETVVIGGQRLSVREYVPAPRQCSKCWRYGHGYKYCQTELDVCPICGAEGHQKDNCTNNSNKKCINCRGNHPAFSKSCAEYKKQQLIVKTQFKEGLSYKEAFKRLKQTGEITSYNYKRALVNENPPTTSTPKIPKVSTANRYSVLQMEEDPQSHTISQQSLQKSPKRKSKRIRNDSSEEGRPSHNMNPKQKPRTSSQNNEMKTHNVVAEIHVDENTPMDDTIIYTEDDNNNVGEKTHIPAEASLSAILPSDLLIPTDIPSELPVVVVPSKIPSKTDDPLEPSTRTTEPSKLPARAAELLEPTSITTSSSEPSLLTPVPSTSSPSTTVSGASSLIAMPSESPSVHKVPTELPLPTKIENSRSTRNSEKRWNITKAECQEKMPKKSYETNKTQATKVTHKLGTLKKDSKNPKKVNTTEPCTNKVKHLVRDYYMPPGFKGGK